MTARVDALGGREAWAYALPFAVLMVAVAAESVLLADSGLDGRLFYPVRAVLVAAVLAWALARANLRPRSQLAPGAVAITLGVGVGVFALWIALDAPWARLGDGSGFDPYAGLNTETGHALAAARLAGAVLVVPLAEELFFRGYLMRVLVHGRFRAVSPEQVPWWAVAAQAGVFALAHAEVLAAFAAGLAYGALYRRTGRLSTAVVAHALTNALLGAWVLMYDAWHLW